MATDSSRLPLARFVLAFFPRHHYERSLAALRQVWILAHVVESIAERAWRGGILGSANAARVSATSDLLGWLYAALGWYNSLFLSNCSRCLHLGGVFV